MIFVVHHDADVLVELAPLPFARLSSDRIATAMVTKVGAGSTHGPQVAKPGVWSFAFLEHPSRHETEDLA